MHNLMFTKALTHCEFFCFATELKKKGREKAHMLYIKEMNKKERAKKAVAEVAVDLPLNIFGVCVLSSWH